MQQHRWKDSSDSLSRQNMLEKKSDHVNSSFDTKQVMRVTATLFHLVSLDIRIYHCCYIVKLLRCIQQIFDLDTEEKA